MSKKEVMILNPRSADGHFYVPLTGWKGIVEAIGGFFEPISGEEVGLPSRFTLCVDEDGIFKKLECNHMFPHLVGAIAITKFNTCENDDGEGILPLTEADKVELEGILGLGVSATQ
jgi:hypothetical protein